MDWNDCSRSHDCSRVYCAVLVEYGVSINHIRSEAVEVVLIYVWITASYYYVVFLTALIALTFAFVSYSYSYSYSDRLHSDRGRVQQSPLFFPLRQCISNIFHAYPLLNTHKIYC